MLLFTVTAYCIWRFVVPLVDTRPELDQCVFGTVGNVGYYKLLSEAKLYPSKQKVRHHTDIHTIDREDGHHLRRFTAGKQGADRQLASIHALIRAILFHVLIESYPALLRYLAHSSGLNVLTILPA